MKIIIECEYDRGKIDMLACPYCPVICVRSGIAKYFYLSKEAKQNNVLYTLTFHDRKVEDSLKIKCNTLSRRIIVDDKHNHYSYTALQEILEQFPNKTAYLTVEYEV